MPAARRTRRRPEASHSSIPRSSAGSTRTSPATEADTVLAAAGQPDTTVVAAFAVGFVSFISPCVLPLVPGYLSAISGVSFAELQEGRRRRRVIVPALLFCLSFTVMFVALGMTATGIGRSLAEHRLLIRHISGVVIFLMGLLFVGTLFIPLLNREWRPEMLLSRA